MSQRTLIGILHKPGFYLSKIVMTEVQPLGVPDRGESHWCPCVYFLKTCWEQECLSDNHRPTHALHIAFLYFNALSSYIYMYVYIISMLIDWYF